MPPSRVVKGIPMQAKREDRVTSEIIMTEKAIKDRTGQDKSSGVIMDKYYEMF